MRYYYGTDLNARRSRITLCLFVDSEVVPS